MKRENPITAHSLDTPRMAWLLACRPNTWIASLSPVLIALFYAYRAGYASWVVACNLILFALSLQISANLVNDLFDSMQGADNPHRKGPRRAMQQGWFTLAAMQRAIACSFGFALLPGLYLVMRVGYWTIPIAISAALAAWYYTAGKNSLAYLGLGDLAAFVFFGPVAMNGSYRAMTLQWNFDIGMLSISSGLLAMALLTANNLRDHSTDQMAGKKTSVVRWGLSFGRWEYALSLFIAIVIPGLIGFTHILYLLPIGGALSYFAFKNRDPSTQFVALLPCTACVIWMYTLLAVYRCCVL